jgi:hypothetical protein
MPLFCSHKENFGDNIEQILNLVNLDPSLLMTEIDSDKNLFLDLLEKGHIPTSENQDGLTLAALDTLRYPNSYEEEYLKTLRDILNPTVKLICNLIVSKLDFHLNILLLHTDKEITCKVFPRAMYLYPKEIFEFKNFSIRQLDEETIRNIRITLGSNPELDKHSEIFFDGWDVQMSEISNRAMTGQIEDLYIKYGKGKYTPKPNCYSEKSIGIHETKKDETKIFSEFTASPGFLKSTDPSEIVRHLRKNMRDDEVLVVYNRTLVYENQDTIDGWEILDASEIPEACFNDPYQYTIEFDETKIHTEITDGERWDFINGWTLYYKNKNHCKRASNRIKYSMQFREDCEYLSLHTDEYLKNADFENGLDLIVNNAAEIVPDDKNDFGTAVRFALKGVDIDYAELTSDLHYFNEFVTRYALSWNGEEIPEGLIEQYDDTPDLLISASVLYKEIRPFLKKLIREDFMINCWWHEYIKELAPESKFQCDREDLFHLPPILRKKINEGGDAEYDGDLSWLNKNPTLLTVKKYLVQDDDCWQGMDHFLEGLAGHAGHLGDYFTLGVMLMCTKVKYASEHISYGVIKRFYHEKNASLNECFTTNHEKLRDDFCDGLRTSGKSDREIIEFLKTNWRSY